MAQLKKFPGLLFSSSNAPENCHAAKDRYGWLAALHGAIEERLLVLRVGLFPRWSSSQAHLQLFHVKDMVAMLDQKLVEDVIGRVLHHLAQGLILVGLVLVLQGPSDNRVESIFDVGALDRISEVKRLVEVSILFAHIRLAGLVGEADARDVLTELAHVVVPLLGVQLRLLRVVVVDDYDTVCALVEARVHLLWLGTANDRPNVEVAVLSVLRDVVRKLTTMHLDLVLLGEPLVAVFIEIFINELAFAGTSVAENN